MNPTILALSISLIFASSLLYAHALPENYSALADDVTLDATAVSPESAALIDGSHPLQIDNSTKLPTFLWAAPERASAMARSAAKSNTKITIEQAARKHLSRFAAIYRLNPSTLANAKLQRVQPMGHNGHIVSFGQQVNGIEVFARRMNLMLDDSQQLTAISGNLEPQASTVKSTFKWTATQAIAAAFHDLHQEDLPVKQLKLHKQQGVYQWYALQIPLSANVEHGLSQPVRIKKVLYPLEKGLEPAYYIELSTKSTADDSHDRANYAYVISAVNGVLLSRSNMTRNDSASAFTYRVWANGTTLTPYDSPFGDDALTPFTATSTKPVSPVVSNLITLTCGPISTCDPWLPATATRTVGNNVAAYADLAEPSGFTQGDRYARLSAPATFDYGYNFSVFDNLQHPKQLQAAIVQAFYTTNFMHDWLYDHGFNESAGNGQVNNFGRGGLSGDRMRVEVNDYNGTDNANMVTPLDGAPATMQLSPWLHDTKSLSVDFNGIKHYYPVKSAEFGQSAFYLKNKKIVLINDGVTTKTDGCETPIVNAADLAGAIALIDRGSCLFAEKAKNAQNAGAIAVLIANNRPEAMIQMAGSDDPVFDSTITIPVLGINRKAGIAIKNALTSATVMATMTRKELPPFNSALDNTIVIHEWGHFLSERLTVALDNNQGKSLGEGWSDFLALLAMVKEHDRSIAGNEQFQAPYAIGQYVSSNNRSAYAFGMRRYPYSTDFSKNPLTFKHISNGVALPKGVPAAPGTDMTGGSNADVHNSGEVWALMLWEAYTALLNDTARLSFSKAQNRMLDYLVESLTMTDANPTFLEARDALLSAAWNRDPADHADYNIFWQAFAKRGAGLNAKAPGRNSQTQTGVVEDYTTP